IGVEIRNSLVPERVVSNPVCVVNDEVVDVAVGVRTSSGEQVVVDVTDAVDVGTKLERVVAGRIRDRICELETALIRESYSIQRRGLTDRDAVGERNLR